MNVDVNVSTMESHVESLCSIRIGTSAAKAQSGSISKKH